MEQKIAKQIVLACVAIFIAASSMFFLRSHAESPTEKPAPCRTALILYDQTSGLDAGPVLSAMLASTLGHFKLDCAIKSTREYKEKECEGYDVIFYLGTSDGAAIPQLFFRDIYKTKKVVVWFKYNIEQVQADAGPDFIKKYGFSFLKKIQEPKDSPGYLNLVSYKDKVLDVTQIDSVVSDLELVAVKIMDPSLARVFSGLKASGANEEVPYMLKAGNFWFIADIPFYQIVSKTRYYIFCDVLHDILSIDHKEEHNALIRLEDVTPFAKPEDLKKVVQFLNKQKVPFAIGVTPFFKDPTGRYFGRPVELTFSDSPGTAEVLRKAQNDGASIVMHGVTHQNDNVSGKDPQLLITSIGYEFWDTENDAPLKEDSVEFVKNRIKKGKDELLKYGLTPVAFETPHYMASALDYRVFAEEFGFMYDQVVYHLYDTAGAAIKPEDQKRAWEYWFSQTFPYVIHKDYYGLFVIPSSTIDSIDYEDASDIDRVNKKVSRILKQIEALKVVRDGYVSFYIHPFLINVMEEHNIDGLAVLKKILDSARKDYIFIDVKTIEKK